MTEDFANNLEQPLIQAGNTHFSLAARGCQGVTNGSPGLCD